MLITVLCSQRQQLITIGHLRDVRNIGVSHRCRGSLEAMTNPLFLVDSSHDDAPMSAEQIASGRTGWIMTLPEGVRRHAFGSMRLTTGDELQISDGHGLRIDATVVDERAGDVCVESFVREEPALVRLSLVQALAKNGHDEQAIDVSTQIGVDDVYPWQSERAIARWKPGRTDRKWRATLMAATEQSRRATLPELHDCLTGKRLVALCGRACAHGDLVVVLHQDATLSWDEVERRVRGVRERSLVDGETRTIHVVVGPEGGIADSEVAALRDAGAEVCVLGHNILRASTAGPVALSLLSRELGRFS